MSVLQESCKVVRYMHDPFSIPKYKKYLNIQLSVPEKISENVIFVTLYPQFG